MVGGIVSRVRNSGGDVELFGRETVRTHGFKGNATTDDYSYEFFLVVRPTSTRRGRLVKQWSFPRQELALVRSESGLNNFYVEGSVAVDGHDTAIVTIGGLLRPFQERVDLTQALR